MRKVVKKPRCGCRWTNARYRSFITSMLRRGSMRWPVKSDVKLAARLPEKRPGPTGRDVFHTTCAKCQKVVPETLSAIDHIDPVIDPATGFVSWDDFIERLFCEAKNLQVLCNECHDEKTLDEKQVAKERRASCK